MISNILNPIPDQFKTKCRDAIIDQIAHTAEEMGKAQTANKIRQLRANADFMQAFEQGLERAIQHFQKEYLLVDEDLTVAILDHPEVFNDPDIQTVMLKILEQPDIYLEQTGQITASFATVLPSRINRERVDKAAIYLLRCLAHELWHLPELQGVYALQFKKLMAENIQQQLATYKAQLATLSRLDHEIKSALAQLGEALAQQKRLVLGNRQDQNKPQVYHNLPQRDYGEFIGRYAELEQIFNLLSGRVRHHLIVVDGIGGIGKSTLVLEVAHRCLVARLKTAQEKEQESQSLLIKLRKTFAERFNEGEIRTLCFDLAIDYEMLPGRDKGAKSQELISYMNRRKRLDELTELIQNMRPDIGLDQDKQQVLTNSETFDAIIWTSAKQTLLTADGIIKRKQVLNTLDDIYLAIAIALDREDITRAPSLNQREIVHKALTRQRSLLIVDNLETVDDEAVTSFLRELPSPTKAIVTTRHRIDVAYSIRLEGMPWEDAQKLIRDECVKKGVDPFSQDIAKALFTRTGGVPLAIVWSIGQIGLGYPINAMLTKLAEPISDIISFCFDESLSLIHDKPAYDLLLALSMATPDASREFLGSVTALPTLARDEGLFTLEKLSLINRQAGRFSLSPLTKILASTKLQKDHDRFMTYGTRRTNYLRNLATRGINYYRLRYGLFRSFEDGENILAALAWAYEYGSADDVFSLIQHTTDYLDGTGRWGAMLDALNEAINLAYATNNRETAAKFLDTKGWLLEQTGNFAQAEQIMQEALAIYQESGNKEAEAAIFQRLGSIARKIGDFELARTYLKKADHIAQHSEDGDLQALIHTAYGKLARDQENWEASWNYFQKVEDWFEKRSTEAPRDEDLAIGNWGHQAIVAYHLGRPKEAKDLCLRSIDFFEKVGTKGYLATLKYRLALAEEALGNIESAITYTEESLYWIDRLGMKPDYPKTKALLDRLLES